MNYSSIYSKVSGAKTWIDQSVCEISKDKPTDCYEGEGKRILMVMKYDSKPWQTSFELKQGDNVLYAGPDATNLPGQNQIWHYDLGILAEGQTYELVVKDSACDGQIQLRGTANEFLPRFEVFEEWADTPASSLGQGPLNNGPPSFTCQYSLFFSVGDLEQVAEEKCPNNVGSGLSSEHCTWLTQFSTLCKSYDIAVSCPVTCSICQSVVTANGNDKYSSIEMGPIIGGPTQNCAWLAAHEDKDALCKRTHIAFHCQSTCNVNQETLQNQ